MKKQTQEQGREGIYKSLLSRSQDLVERASKTTESNPFDIYVEEFADLRKDYLTNFESMTSKELERGRYLLDSTDSYIRNRLDVVRVREMRKALRESKGNKYGFK